MKERERQNFLAYVDAIGRSVGHDATATEARAACPQESAAWRQSFIDAYGYDPARGARWGD
jgi:hypothetical protein